MDKKLIRKIEAVFFGVVFVVLVIVIGNYAGLNPKKIAHDAKVAVLEYMRSRDYACAAGEKRIVLPDGMLCRPEAEDSVLLHVYDTYPKSSGGKDVMYAFLNQGDMAAADAYLQDLHPVERFDSIKITPPITWKEDPYDDVYWRFIFYSLRSTRNLLVATRETGETAYSDKLVEILDSFLDRGMSSELSWQDNHAVAFRTMILVDTWWKLREMNLLKVDLSTKMLSALEVHGDFLHDNNHYERGHNHGTNEAAALYLLAVNFPDMPHSAEWLAKAKERLNIGLDDLIDEDGALIENSPFYHFYTLEKYWEIYQYSEKFGVSVSPDFEQKLKNMMAYGTYVLQPNLHVPLLGASLDQHISLTDEYLELTKLDPYLLYVLTEGKKGQVPPKTSINFPTTGQTIMRSGWGKGADFEAQTQVIFDMGAYRTDHSDLDALSFNLYSKNITLMPDAGLYEYAGGADRTYFHGTSAHNTVMVDGKDQEEGTATQGEFVEGDGYVHQSAQHELYPGVQHRRAVTLIADNLVLVVDQLESETEHEYEQLFHLFPGAKLDVQGLTASARGQESDQRVAVHQLLEDGIALDAISAREKPMQGFCSSQYNVKKPCTALSYKQKSTNASYITLIEIGKPDKSLTYSYDRDAHTVAISNKGKDYSISIDTSSGTGKKILVEGKENVRPGNKTDIGLFGNAQEWSTQGHNGPGGIVDIVTEPGGDKSLHLVSGVDGANTEAVKDVQLDLSGRNLLFRMKMKNRTGDRRVEISVSSNNWKGYATNDLKNSYRLEDDGDWYSVSLGKGEVRQAGGQWRIYGTGFDWSKIDKIRFRIGSNAGQKVELKINQLSTVQGQREGSVVVVFDDGYESILPAADVMRSYGMKGNVAVIADRVERISNGYLSVRQLRTLQDEYGWDMANHSRFHRDALGAYFQNGSLDDFEKDLLSGTEFLIKNSLNSAPNWYIYPHGATNEEIKDVVGKYYTFARTTRNEPEVFPFGDPLSVKTFSADGAESGDGDEVFKKPEDIIRAIQDAKKYRQTLFLTFHRIHTTVADRPGYPIEDFKKIAQFLSESGISVRSLSELDASNGVGKTQLTLEDGTAKQITMSISLQKQGFFESLFKKDEQKASDTVTLDHVLVEDFSQEGKLEEVGQMSKSTDQDWWINSGASLTMSGGTGKTLQGDMPESSHWRKDYLDYNADSTDNGLHPQNIFRMVARSNWKNLEQEAYFKIVKNNLSHGVHRNESNGLLLFNRYLDGDNLYYTGLRVDGYAVIKKKIRGTYYTMAYAQVIPGAKYDLKTNPNLFRTDTWIGLKSEVKDLDANRVSIKVYADIGKTGVWTLVAEAIDDGVTYGGASILKPGHAGIRTDFMDVELDDYKIRELNEK